MAHQFTNNMKTKMIQAAVADAMDYVKKSKSYLSESEMKGKKYGKSYKVYIPDPGTVGEDLEATPDSINEIEYEITLENRNTAVEIDAWDDIVNIEDFKKEIALPRGTKLAKSVQQAVIDKTVFEASNAVIGEANLETLAMASAQLEEMEIAGTKVAFNNPTVTAKISAKALGQFIPDSIQKDIYGKNYLGEFATASQIALAGLPVVKAATTSAGLNVRLVSDKDGNPLGLEPINEIMGDVKKGEAFKVAGLKAVDCNGLVTDQDYVVIALADADPDTHKAPCSEIRVEIGETGYNNPNASFAVVSDMTGALTPMLEAGKSYYVGVVREDSALAFDTYKFNDLPGSENETVTVDGVSVKMSKYGNGQNMTTFVRLDCPFACGVPDSRRQCVIYIEK